MKKKLLILAGDGIGPEVMNEVKKIIEVIKEKGLEEPFKMALYKSQEFHRVRLQTSRAGNRERSLL